MRFLLTIALVLFTTSVFAERTQNELASHLQDISVTIKSDRSQGSGVIVTREIKFAKDSKPEKVNFVWTAAHVVDNLRGTRIVINPQGQSRTVVQFKDAAIVQELIEGGRRVGELKMDAKVIKYSDSDNGQDLALLMIRKRGFVDVSADFHVGEPKIIPVGTTLYHVGSLHGQVGANSLTSGIISQVGRVINLGKGDGTIFDQTTATAFPGCLTEDSVIYTSEGYKKITNIRLGDTVLAYDSIVPLANGTWSNSIQPNNDVLSFQTITGELSHKTSNRPVTKGKVLNVWPTGEKEVFKISTRNRTVRASGNHPFVRARPISSIDNRVYWIAEWCSVSDLNIGDIVGVMKQHVEFKKSQNLNFTQTFGNKDNHLPAMRLIGFYVGDGYSRIRKSEGGEVCLYTFNDNDSALYKSYVEKIFPNVNVNYVHNESGSYLRISSVKFAQFFKDLGVTGNAKTKRIPKWIFTCPLEYQKEFLEGLVDADGHRTNNYYIMELANEKLIQDIWALSNNIGWGASNISTRTKTVTIKGRIVKSTTWTCELYPNIIRKSAQMNGTIDLLPKDLKWERIASIASDGVEMTYDMEIDKYHNFFANGFLVHNSSGGGVFIADTGLYCGMLVRGSGETFNLIVPIRRMKVWAKKVGVEWALDTTIDPPYLSDVLNQPIEDIGVSFTAHEKAQLSNKKYNLKFMTGELQLNPQIKTQK